MTEAEIAIRQALHVLEVQRGNGVINPPELRNILESGLPNVPVRVLRRAAVQGEDLLGLDDIDGR